MLKEKVDSTSEQPDRLQASNDERRSSVRVNGRGASPVDRGAFRIFQRVRATRPRG